MMKIKWNKIAKISLCLILGFLIAGSISLYIIRTDRNINKEAIDGVLDISNWNFEKNGIVSLKGEWIFEWNEFISPNQTFDKHKAKTIKVPSAWNWRQKNGHRLLTLNHKLYPSKLNQNSLLFFMFLTSHI